MELSGRIWYWTDNRKLIYKYKKRVTLPYGWLVESKQDIRTIAIEENQLALLPNYDLVVTDSDDALFKSDMRYLKKAMKEGTIKLED